VSLPTWIDLVHNHCTKVTLNQGSPNPLYEPLSSRRYNYASSKDVSSIRLLFLSPILESKRNKTLIRQGRFVWCKNLQYAGTSQEGLRQVSFTIDKGRKRFVTTENNLLCIPAKVFVNNSRYLRNKHSLFRGFSSVFGYENTVRMMLSGPTHPSGDYEDFVSLLASDNPYRPGTLVAPRVGYFYPAVAPLGSTMNEIFSRFESEVPVRAKEKKAIEDYIFRDRPVSSAEECVALERFGEWTAADAASRHPYGIILGPSFENNKNTGREFYRVRFGETTYERVHPVEMEILK